MEPISPIFHSNIVSQYSRTYVLDAFRNEVKTVNYIESQGQVRVEVTYQTYDKYGTVTEHKPPTIDIMA